MDELILKIKELKNVHPERKWMKATKAKILAEERISLRRVFAEAREMASFSWLRERSYLLVPGFLMLLVIGVFAYNQVMLRRETASVDVAALETISQGLRTVQDGINKTTSSLGKIDEPKKALEIQEMVKAAIEEGGKVVSATQKIVEKPKESKNSPQVYSVISGVENAGQDLKYALEDMEQTYLEKQKEVARALIEELGAKNLSEEQTKLLEQAKNDYNNGLFGEALTKAIEISQGQK